MLDKTDGSRIIPQFNLAQYLAENQDRNDGVAPFINLQFAEAKTPAPKTFGEYPKAVTLPDGQQFVARDAEQEAATVAAFKASTAQGAPAAGGAGAPGADSKAKA